MTLAIDLNSGPPLRPSSANPLEWHCAVTPLASITQVLRLCYAAKIGALTVEAITRYVIDLLMNCGSSDEAMQKHDAILAARLTDPRLCVP